MIRAAARYALRARPGFVSSWLRTLAARPTSSPPEIRRVDERNPDEFQHPGRSPAAKVGPKAALRPAPEIVGEAERCDRGHRRTVRHPHLPADEWKPRPTEVDAERAAGIEHVPQLAPPVDEAAQVTAGWAMPKRQLDLPDAKPRSRRVDRHPHLAAEPGSDGKRRGSRSRRKRALTGERFARLHPGQELDQDASCPLRDAETATGLLGERRDGEIRLAVEYLRELTGEIGVAEQQRSGGSCPLACRQSLPLATAREAQHDGARFFCEVRGAVPGAVVGDDHLGRGKRAT
jgi:hypothetical protein